jgi:hypothetical protein
MGANAIDVGYPIVLDDLKGGDMAEWPIELPPMSQSLPS